MKSIYNILLFTALASAFSSCRKDPLDDVNSGDWNRERNILAISLYGQIGDAVISRDDETARIEFRYNTALGEDLSAIMVESLELSYGASSSVKAGESLNFNTPDSTASIIVTPVNGDPLIWTIKLIPFTEVLLGTWNIAGLYVYGGTGPAYGGAAVFEMNDKPWCWNEGTGPAAEHDNTLSFTFTGINDAGNTYGTVVNNPGSDGNFADFTFVLSDPDVDVNEKYRLIPKGEGIWEHNQSDGTVKFVFPEGRTTILTLNTAGTETLYTDSERTITKTTYDYSFSVVLTGTDDWDNIYSDYDKFVVNPRKFWIDITKAR